MAKNSNTKRTIVTFSTHHDLATSAVRCYPLKANIAFASYGPPTFVAQTKADRTPNKRNGQLFLRFMPSAVAVMLSMTTAMCQATEPVPHFALTTPDGRLTTRVPEEYIANVFGCTGGNQSPALRWTGAPAGTLSFVITLFDPDVRSTPSGWWHWVVYDLPANVEHVPVGAGREHSDLLPARTRQGRTDLGTAAFHGPCPDKGARPHRYVFTIYALNIDALPVPDEASGAMVTSTAQEHLLATAVYVAHYGR